MSFSDWSRAASTYLNYFKSNQDRFRRELLDPILLNALNPRGKSILDIGCGEGYFSRVMKAVGAKHIVGIDIAPELIESARHQDPSGEYEVYDIVSAPVLWPDKFDGAVAHMVMMDVSDIDTAYK